MKYILLFFFFTSFVTMSQSIAWRQLSSAVLEEAKSENKIILLNLKANWCHWCHVMDDSTYSNLAVQEYIETHFIPVKADQDANPELSARYKEYGWPATIFINGNGEDVVKRAGYISPEPFLRLLKAIVADPSPEEETGFPTVLKASPDSDKSVLNDLQKAFENALDYEDGGFDQDQKFIENDTYEYALFNGKEVKIKNWIKTSVNGARKLCDPAWGGVYQYSTHDDWEHLHFEKLLSIQTRYLRIFHYFNLYFPEEETAQKEIDGILRYINRFFKHENGLYSNAQDADLVQGEHAEEYFRLGDKERMKLGVPKVDTNTYTYNNAELARSLLILSYGNEGDGSYARTSHKILESLAQRKASNNLYFHAAEKRKVWSLKDQIAMALLLIEELKANQNNKEVKELLNTFLSAVAKQFINENGSAKSFVGDNGLIAQPLIEENIQLARIFNWYSYFSNQKKYKVLAKGLFDYLIHPEIAKVYYSQPALLMLSKELNEAPLEFVFVRNGEGSSLSDKARSYAPFYSLFSDYSKDELPQEKEELFGDFEVNVLFACTANYCSSPMYDKGDVGEFFK
ncbi:DUF255 domain-containing protein [Brumimicrobium aurantiacum]|uniref:Thioredoxin domain-containing protein n=1 Tax=Brumimicrobium aurantiacum TaxID=1737063 RepID=A0A3E1EYF6_9FLAO|nr:DUF255 domain-containing protein [Brumimicrobium aurantiacum]RFC54590.1 thioredoxin domain-containing protein [Brumimicrobium aurantiacum]